MTDVPPGTPAVRGGDAMTRSEEELLIDKVVRPVGRVRVRKYIVTEDVTVTVSVRREEIAVESIDGEDDNSLPVGDQRSADEPLELVLHREEFEVVKRVVPVERVRVTKERRRTEQVIDDEVRKERIEVQLPEGGVD